jgi:hypothetical protein
MKKSIFVTNSLTESMVKGSNNGGYALDMMGLISLNKLKKKESSIVYSLKRKPLINKFIDLGFDYNNAEKVELFRAKEDDLIVVVSATEAGLPKSLLEDKELGKLVELECRLYKIIKRETQPTAEQALNLI